MGNQAVPTDPVEEPRQDFGLGGKLAERSSKRLLNQDGTFNVYRNGPGALHPLNLYHTFLKLAPWKLGLLLVAAHIAVNLLFAFFYWLCGPEAITGAAREGLARLEDCFFFSVQTIATIGYGRMTPATRMANLLVALEALIGLLGFAILSALLYARFVRPTARVRFSVKALIAPYEGGWALMFRLANLRNHDLTDVHATVSYGCWVMEDGKRVRDFQYLKLERQEVSFMPLHWVVVHPVDERSPLYGATKQTFEDSDPEVFVLLTADDETFAQTVHARSSYRKEDVVWGAKFSDMYVPHERMVAIDLALLDDFETLEAPERL